MADGTWAIQEASRGNKEPDRVTQRQLSWLRYQQTISAARFEIMLQMCIVPHRKTSSECLSTVICDPSIKEAGLVQDI